MNRNNETSEDPGLSAVKAGVQAAWQALEQGKAEKALQISNQLLVQRAANRAQVPWAQASLVLALNEHVLGRNAQAAQRLYGVMASLPGSDLAMQLYLSMLRDLVRKSKPSDLNATPGRIVLGLGTGRSGSTSLSYLFSAQESTYFSHEHAPMVPWYQGQGQCNFHLTRMALLARLFGCVADVSHWWLPKLDTIIRRFPGVRVVVTQRNKDETVDSFLTIKGAKTAAKPINHWMKHDGTLYRRNLWDQCYPKFDADNLRQALEMYWDDYYEKALLFAERYPEHVRVFQIDALSSPSGQMDLLGFCGFQDAILLTDSRMNKGSTADGKNFWKNPFE